VKRLFLRVQRILATVLFVGYVVWNGYWLCLGRVPPSLFLAVTGLPSPTTGGTRSVQQLWQGNWRESLKWHPLAVPIILLFLLSLGWLGWQALTRQRLRLPEWFLWAWGICLGISWVVKLLGDPQYW
jgi:hypothetical protein